MNHSHILEGKIAVLILAAGSSKRLGQPKQLLEWNGATLVEQAVLAAQGAGLRNILVVTGKAHHTIKAIIGSTAICTQNPVWEYGMGSSISFGVSVAQDVYPNLEAVLILPCDQPHATSDYLAGFLSNYSGNPNQIIVSEYGGTFGPPSLFGKEYFAKLGNLKGEEGGKNIVEANTKFVSQIPFPLGVIDIDTKVDWEAFVESEKELKRRNW